jgi:hypothetical protein
MEEKLKNGQDTNSSLAASFEQLLQKSIQDHLSGFGAKVQVKKENPGKVCNFKSIRFTEKHNQEIISD